MIYSEYIVLEPKDVDMWTTEKLCVKEDYGFVGNFCWGPEKLVP